MEEHKIFLLNSDIFIFSVHWYERMIRCMNRVKVLNYKYSVESMQ